MNKNTVKTINSAISNFGGAMDNGGSFVKKAVNDYFALSKSNVISHKKALYLANATKDIGKRINLDESKLNFDDVLKSEKIISLDETFVERQLYILQLKAQGTYSKEKVSNFTIHIANQNYQNNGIC